MPQPDLIRDTICVSETILDSSAEQPVELDYFLPDYYPNIFKILKTTILPAVQSCKIANSKLTLDGIACIRVHYIAEESSRLCAIEQKTPFSKSIDLPAECQNPAIQVIPRCYFASGRAVNPRRLDIRGGISCKIRVLDQREIPVISGGSGEGLQCHCRVLPLCGIRKSACKPFVVTEELELDAAAPSFGSLLDLHVSAVPTECRLLTNKAVCRGDVTLHLLYQPEDENAAPQTVDFTIPISQIADLPGVEEGHLCDARFEITGIDLEPRPNESGENRIISCEFTANLFCNAGKNQEVQIADDAYSTAYETELTSQPARAERLVQTLDQLLTIRQTIDSPAPIASVLDASALLGDAAVKAENGELLLCGNLELSAFCRSTDSVPFRVEKTIPAEVKLLSGLGERELSLFPAADVLSTGFAVLSETQLELRAELRVSGLLCESVRFPAISDIHLQEDAPRTRDPLCALRICYASAGDRVWEIAKACSASMQAVMEENELEDEVLSEPSMLLIPLIDG